MCDSSDAGINFKKECSKIDTTVALFRNFSPEKPIANAVVYFWESHTKNPDDEPKIKATEDLIYKLFDMVSCEKYEIPTGYLSRYNYLKKPWTEAAEKDFEEAIKKGEQDQKEWFERCKPNLPGFIRRNWQDCITNRYYESCLKLIENALATNEQFYDAYINAVDEYIERRGNTLQVNGKKYMLEEMAWITSLSLLHINKQVYLIHVGNDNSAIRGLFHHFPNLSRAVKWLAPRFKTVSFAGVADFLMYYRVDRRSGCDFASMNPDLVRPINSFSNNDISKEELSFMLGREQSEKEFLLSVIGKIPGHVYWLNRNNVYMGCNDLQAHDLGLKAKEEIIGKTNRDLHPAEEADQLDKTNIEVMESGKTYEGEEYASVSNVNKSYLTRKTPLFDIHGKVVGLLGLSVDLTDRKRAETLEIANKLQENRLRDHESFRRFISRMAHDITSPLVGLETFVKSCDTLTEKQHVMLKSIVTSIKAISEVLLVQYKNNEHANSMLTVHAIPVASALSEIISQKEQEYKNRDIEIIFYTEPGAEFAFINADRNGFDRMISNLINNSADAFENKKGIVEVSVGTDKNFVKLRVNDNGRGIPKNILEKIKNNIPAGTTKKTGHGLGMSQVRETLGLYHGKLEIMSKEGIGTAISLTFPRCGAPSWFTDKITFKKGSTVLILDDDKTMHEIWKEYLSKYDLKLEFFTDEKSITDYVSLVPQNERENMFILSDYDLRSGKSGLIVVMELKMKDRAAIVTSVTNDREVFDLAERLGMKVIPKQQINNLRIEVE